MSVVFVWRPCKQLTHGLSFHIERTLQFLPESQSLLLAKMAISFLVIIFSLLSMQMTLLLSHIRLGILEAYRNMYFLSCCHKRALSCVANACGHWLVVWSHSFWKRSWRFTLCDSVVADAHACIYTFTHTQTEMLTNYYCNHGGICKHAQYLA